MPPADRKVPEEDASPRDLPEAPAENFPAWEMIEAGRYRPRRIRGSFPGRELG
jgi:hypothetical protein